MVELDLKEGEGENLDCPECGEGWLALDRDDTMVCQNCGARFDRNELLKNIRKRGY